MFHPASSPGFGIHAAVVRYGEPDGQGIHVDVCEGNNLMNVRQEAGTDLIIQVANIDYEVAEHMRTAVKGEADGSIGRRQLTRLVRELVHEVMVEHGIDAAGGRDGL